MGKLDLAKVYIIKRLLVEKEVSLDSLSKEISLNIGSLNLYEPISKLRRPNNFMIGLSEDYKKYIIVQTLDGKVFFPKGYADSIAHINNKMSSREMWRLFKHDDSNYYFDNQPQIKDIPMKLIEANNLEELGLNENDLR